MRSSCFLYTYMCPFLTNFFLPLRESNCFLKMICPNKSRTLLLRIVILFFIITKHSVSSEMRSHFSNSIFDITTPFYRYTFLIFIIESRSYLVFYNIIDKLCIQFILIGLVFISTFLRKSPTRIRAVTLYPPAVQYTEVHHSIHCCFLTTSS